MAGFWVVNQAISWWNMVSACQDFSDASNVINCVWGAVTTAITVAGAFYGGMQKIGNIASWISDTYIGFGGFKRSSVDQELIDAFSEILGTPVSHLGSWDYAPLELDGSLRARKSKDPIDVFGFTSQTGLPMHFSFLGHMENMGGSKKKQVAFKFGMGPASYLPGSEEGICLTSSTSPTAGLTSSSTRTQVMEAFLAPITTTDRWITRYHARWAGLAMQLATTSKFTTTIIMAPLLGERLHLSAVLITGVQLPRCTMSLFHSQIARLVMCLKDILADCGG
jgi:hypothetical protein